MTSAAVAGGVANPSEGKRGAFSRQQVIASFIEGCYMCMYIYIDITVYACDWLSNTHDWLCYLRNNT